MSFAVIETGGKQYKVEQGQTITTEKLPGEYKEGDTVVFDRVLLIDDGENTKIGTPYVEGATVEGTFVENGFNKKISVIRFRSKSRHFKRKGHRQANVKVEIGKIKG